MGSVQKKISDFNKTRVYTLDGGIITQVEQGYVDGTKEIFSLGDRTNIGKILEFKSNGSMLFAVGDYPANTSQNPNTSWDWVYELERSEEFNRPVLCSFCSSTTNSCTDIEAETCPGNENKIKENTKEEAKETFRKEVKFESYPPKIPGGQSCGVLETGVTLISEALSLRITVAYERSQLKNRETAMLLFEQFLNYKIK